MDSFVVTLSIVSLLLAISWFLWQAVTSQAKPTFNHDIGQILHEYCAACHRPGEAGPFSLLTYEDAKKHAHQIEAVTRTRYMPPWLPQSGYGDFADKRQLTEPQIRTISAWVQAGSPEGLASKTPPQPSYTDGWQLGAPDLILEAPKPFQLPASGPDVFWNFIYTPNTKTRRYVRAIEIRPGNKRIVHHANLILDPSGLSRTREATPGAGFPGMDLTIERSSFDFESHFLFWKPGTVPYTEPDGMAWRFDPGITPRTQYAPAALRQTGTGQPSIGFYFTDQPPNRFPILIQLEHDGALNIAPGIRDFVVSDDFRLPLDADVLAVYPHAHYLGKLLGAYATLPNGHRTWLTRIPNWDLNRQAVYHYREPIFLPKGSTISMRYQYDNSAGNPRNPNHPRMRVRAGDQATDEMGHLWLQVLPRGPGDSSAGVGGGFDAPPAGKIPWRLSGTPQIGSC